MNTPLPTPMPTNGTMRPAAVPVMHPTICYCDGPAAGGPGMHPGVCNPLTPRTTYAKTFEHLKTDQR
jgi:hypothetical protein